MTSREFILIWQNFFEYTKKHHQEELEQTSNDEWRKVLLGPKETSSQNCPIADFIKKKNFRFARYYKEYMGLDLVFSTQENVSGLKAVYPEDEGKGDILERSAFLPRSIDFIIAHENDIKKCHEKMLHLINYKSKLKVLITYDWENEKGDEHKYNYMTNVIGKNFHQIIDQSSLGYSENPNTEYLLIVGYKNEDNLVCWNFYIYNIKAHSVYTKYQPI